MGEGGGRGQGREREGRKGVTTGAKSNTAHGEAKVGEGERTGEGQWRSPGGGAFERLEQ